MAKRRAAGEGGLFQRADGMWVGSVEIRSMDGVRRQKRVNAEVVFIGSDNEPFTTSLVIAQQTGNEHASVIKLIRDNLDDLNEIGTSRFQIAKSGGRPTEFAALDEPAAALLMTYLRNTPKVKDFKKRLVRDFYEMRRRLQGIERIDLSDPIAAIEAANTRSQQAIEIAKSERDRADRAEKQVEVEQKHRRAIEGGDGILLTDFGKKYFSDVRHTDFFEHLYAKAWLIDQRGTRLNKDGEVRNGYNHGKPTYKGRPFIYEHDQGTHGGRRRFQPRVRPQREVELRDALASEGLPVNTHSTGLIRLTDDDKRKLEAAK